jgi:plastocyanin
MRITTLVFSLLILSGANAVAADHTVTMKSISFEPKVLKIKVGDAVAWTNTSYTTHSATSQKVAGAAADSLFDTGLIDPKKTSKKVKFEKPGTYKYHCSIHGTSMSATVEVQP